MSVIGSNILAGASGQGGDYTIARSLRFRSSASAYLNRTFTTPTSGTTWTYSTWVKRGTLGVESCLLSAGTSGTSYIYFRFEANGELYFITENPSLYRIKTTAVYRDPSAWYHIVLQVDTTQATADNRMRLYVNGVQVTSLVLNAQPPQNTALLINSATAHNIGRRTYFNDQHQDLYQAEIHFIDGQALTPSSFGANSTTTGVWQPKKYAGTYGNNGFYLPFSDNASTTTLGNDFSGNGNNWTTNNISLTAGSTYDSMTDVPTLTSATAANYCVMNPLDTGATGSTISNGNLTVATAVSGFRYMGNTMWVASGKFYAEFTLTATSGFAQIGIATTTTSTNKTLGQDSTSWSYNSWNGSSSNNSSATTFGNSWTTNDVIGIALDKDTNKLYFSKNGTWQNSADPAAGTGSLNISSIAGLETLIGVCDNENEGSATFQANFGQRPFAYTPPTGFVALNTFNLPTPTIGATASTQANKYFDTTIYSGNGTSSQTITNSGSMQPDFVWLKRRESTSNHGLYDVLRGVNQVLYTNLTDATSTLSGVSAFNSNGFSLGSSFNASGGSYVGWQWRASNATAVSNTAGSITSTVSANTSAGFSVVTYAGTGTAGSVGHGLGVQPAMIIVKNRTNDADWLVQSKYTTTPYQRPLFLNKTDAQLGSDITAFGTASSTVFNVSNGLNNNGSGSNYVAYCFAEIAGYSKFGSFVGNGSTDGTFVYTGFRPRYVMIKNASAAGNDWKVFDTARNTANPETLVLYPNLSNAEDTNTGIDFTANGFKLRDNGSSLNGNGNTMIYACFAENPYKYSLAR
jgi:hypothetical protein